MRSQSVVGCPVDTTERGTGSKHAVELGEGRRSVGDVVDGQGADARIERLRRVGQRLAEPEQVDPCPLPAA